MSVMPKDQAAELRQLMQSFEVGSREAAEVSDFESASCAKAAHVVAIASGKGGVGKTNIAVNLAIRLSQTGHRVVLVDADLGTANVDVVMNIQSSYDLSHVLRRQRAIEDIAVQVDARLRLIVGASGLESVADLGPFERQELIEELGGLERQCDIILLDCGAGISQNVLAFAQAADEALIVTTPEPTAITDAYALVKVLSRTNKAPPLGLIVNQAATVREARQVTERIVSVAARFLKVPIEGTGQILRDHHVGQAVRERVPLILKYPRCPASNGLSTLAKRVGQSLNGTNSKPGFFRRVLNFFD
ncbi:MAG: MinD/ParA family protein [Phycisphaerales bacterium]|nr:MinD/ParA family protein [Phycisphaerales bacterium]